MQKLCSYGGLHCNVVYAKWTFVMAGIVQPQRAMWSWGVVNE